MMGGHFAFCFDFHRSVELLFTNSSSRRELVPFAGIRVATRYLLLQPGIS
jgi:hypothetical protein